MTSKDALKQLCKMAGETSLYLNLVEETPCVCEYMSEDQEYPDQVINQMWTAIYNHREVLMEKKIFVFKPKWSEEDFDVRWSQEDQAYLASVEGLPSLMTHGDTREEAIAELKFILENEDESSD